MTQTPVLHTGRLTLGPFSMAHFDAFRVFAATERALYLGGPSDDPRDAWDSCMIYAGQWVARGYGAFFASETATGTPAGRFSIWHPINFEEPELSWVLYADFEGQGLAIEGARAVRKWAAGQGLAPLVSYIAPENTRSIALAKALGCTFEKDIQYPSGAVVGAWRHPKVAA